MSRELEVGHGYRVYTAMDIELKDLQWTFLLKTFRGKLSFDGGRARDTVHYYIIL